MITSIIGLVIATFGSAFGLVQWNHSNKIKKAEFLKQIIDQLRFNDNLSKTMYMIEYSDNWYSVKFHNSPEEKEIDKFLAYINYVCYLRNNKIITENEFKFLRYEITRVCSNIQVQSYLWNLYHFSKRMNTICSFSELVKYGLEEKLIPDYFTNEKSKKYIQNLNF
jgi:RNA processing factor Prp31